MPTVPFPHHEAPDSQPMRGTQFDDLDLDRVGHHIDQAVQRQRLPEPMPPREFLIAYGGVAFPDAHTADPVPTIAGILMFAKKPQRLMPYASVSLGHFYGIHAISSEVVHLEKGIGGTLPQQIELVERYLWSNVHHGFRLGDGPQRIEEDEYPRRVLRELTVNALAHRDYWRNHATQVSLFRNRITWDNPGRLPEGVTIDTLVEAHFPRNPSLLEFLYQVGYVESFGLGWDTVYTTLRDEGLAEPTIQELRNSFSVTIYGHPRGVFSDAVPSMISELSDIQQQLYRMIADRGSVSRSDIEAAFPDRSMRSLQRDLQELLDRQLIETSGATRSLRYRI